MQTTVWQPMNYKTYENKTNLESSPKLLVKQEPRELSSARSLKKLNKNLPQWPLKLISSSFKLRVANKVSLVVVSLEFMQQSFKFRLVQVLVDLCIKKHLHFIKVSSVEPWSEQCLLYPLFGPLRLCRGGGGGRGPGNHRLRPEAVELGGGGGGVEFYCGTFHGLDERKLSCCHCCLESEGEWACRLFMWGWRWWSDGNLSLWLGLIHWNLMLLMRWWHVALGSLDWFSWLVWWHVGFRVRGLVSFGWNSQNILSNCLSLIWHAFGW